MERKPTEGRSPGTREGRRMAIDEREVTVVGPGATLEGNIVSAGSLRIDGQVKGEISSDGDVILSPQSQVEADISAENVTISGRFKGNITVKGTAELTRGGRLDGNVTSKTLIVQEGGVFQGQSTMEQQPAPQASTGTSRSSSAGPTSGAGATTTEDAAADGSGGEKSTVG